jgi:hypothetical protein
MHFDTRKWYDGCLPIACYNKCHKIERKWSVKYLVATSRQNRGEICSLIMDNSGWTLFINKKIRRWWCRNQEEAQLGVWTNSTSW